MKKSFFSKKHDLNYVTSRKRRFLLCPSFSEGLVLEKKIYNVSHFELYNLKRLRLRKISAIKKSRFELRYCTRTTYFAFFVVLRRHDFKIGTLRHVRFWNIEFTMCRIMIMKKCKTCRNSHKICSQKITLKTRSLRGGDTFRLFPAFSKRMILK